MKRVLIYGLVLILLVVFNNVVNTCLHKRKLPEMLENQYQIQRDIARETKPKVILVGSSTTKTGYSVNALIKELPLDQKDILNLGTMPNNAEINFYVLQQLFKDLDPYLIVYGIDPWIFSEYYFQNFNYKLSRWSIKQRIDYIRSMKPNMGRIIDVLNGGNMFSNVQSLFQKGGNSQLGLTEDRDWHGKDPMANIAYADWFNYPRFGVSQDFVGALRDLDELCKENDCKLIVHIPIYSETFIDQYLKTEFHDVFSPLIKDSIRHGEVDLSLHSLPDSLFWDGIHVMEAGKHWQTERMVNVIQSALSDHFGQEHSVEVH